MIGREKNPETSEVARLIEQSLQLDRQKAEEKNRQQQRVHDDDIQRMQNELDIRRHELQQQMSSQKARQEQVLIAPCLKSNCSDNVLTFVHDPINTSIKETFFQDSPEITNFLLLIF